MFHFYGSTDLKVKLTWGVAYLKYVYVNHINNVQLVKQSRVKKSNYALWVGYIWYLNYDCVFD